MTLMERPRPAEEGPLKPEIETLDAGQSYGRFRVEPLDAGFGTTLGNALRRVLLSSLPGAAVTAIKIDGVQHEFSSIPNVREDTTQFLLNVKKIRLRPYSDRPGRLVLDRQGPGQVTAADLEAQGEFEVVNPDLYLATIDSAEGRLSIDFVVEHGTGFVRAGENRENHSIGLIPVDAIFTPIRKVNYVVEPMRVGIHTYDRLYLEVWTDGTIQPANAVSKAAQMLMDQLRLFSDLRKPGAPLPSPANPNKPRIPQPLYDTPIEELELSVRTYNALKRHQILKVGQVMDMSDDDLLAVRNFGTKSLTELKESLVSHGFLTEEEAGSVGSDEDGEDEYELDEDGNPLLDMFGKPIPRNISEDDEE